MLCLRSLFTDVARKTSLGLRVGNLAISAVSGLRCLGLRVCHQREPCSPIRCSFTVSFEALLVVCAVHFHMNFNRIWSISTEKQKQKQKPRLPWYFREENVRSADQLGFCHLEYRELFSGENSVCLCVSVHVLCVCVLCYIVCVCMCVYV